jgi:signal transduction histidine kinase/CheY-like chemotaxis protein
VHPEDADRVDRTVREAVQQGTEFELEYRVHAGARGWRWFRSSGRIRRNGHTHPRLFSGIADITERRSLEAQLRRAQKMDAIGQLAGGVAHDFNNILTAIAGYSHLVLESATESQRQDIEEIVKAADRAAALTRQLLSFSTRHVVERTLLDLNALIGDAVTVLRPLIGEDIELTTRTARSLPLVKGDRTQLEQVLMNLVINARDAIDGTGTITIDTSTADLAEGETSATPAPSPGPYVVLRVGDTGGGMTDEVRSRLFEPFFTTKPQGQGAGLGLATVYGIVSQSGGSIAVASEAGCGSAFTVYFPAHQEAAMPVSASEHAAPAPAAETVLLAEDELAVRMLARRILQRAGYTVVEAANAAEAESRAATMDAIDLLLTDVMMPGGSGPELFRRLAAVRPGLRVLFMSGYAEQDLFDRVAIEPGTPFLKKPFTIDTLTARVRDVLSRS